MSNPRPSHRRVSRFQYTALVAAIVGAIGAVISTLLPVLGNAVLGPDRGNRPIESPTTVTAAPTRTGGVGATPPPPTTSTQPSSEHPTQPIAGGAQFTVVVTIAAQPNSGGDGNTVAEIFAGFSAVGGLLAGAAAWRGRKAREAEPKVATATPPHGAVKLRPRQPHSEQSDDTKRDSGTGWPQR